MRRLRSWLTDRTTMPGRPVVAGLVGLLILAAGSARAQGPNRTGGKFYPDSSDDAEKLLRNAANHAHDRQWSEAINIYQRVIDQFGDKVAQLPKTEPAALADSDFVLYVDDRSFCHAAIAQLPPEARRDLSQPGRWDWPSAGSARERKSGISVCSAGSSTRRFAVRGATTRSSCWETWRFRTAALVKRWHVSASGGGPSRRLQFTGSSRSVGRPGQVARQETALPRGRGRKCAGQGRARRVCAALSRATGALAGRTGVYAAILAESLESDHLAPPISARQPWPTFAGSLTRSKVVAGPIDVGSTQWRVELEKVWVNRQPAFGPAEAVIGAATDTPRAAPGLPSDRAGRPGDRLRRHAGPGVQPE